MEEKRRQRIWKRRRKERRWRYKWRRKWRRRRERKKLEEEKKEKEKEGMEEGEGRRKQMAAWEEASVPELGETGEPKHQVLHCVCSQSM